jgi:hypothetical protein
MILAGLPSHAPHGPRRPDLTKAMRRGGEPHPPLDQLDRTQAGLRARRLAITRIATVINAAITSDD